MTRNGLQRLILGAILLVFLVVITIAVRTLVTKPHPGANDFAQRWYGASAFWKTGINPYDPKVSLGAELFLYGAPVGQAPELDQYPGDFLYPFHTALIMAPLTIFTYDYDGYSWASAIWMVVTATCIVVAFLTLADTYGWRLNPLLVTIGGLWAVTFYYAARGIFLGQPGVVVVCLHLITLWALAKDRDLVAGIVLAISTYKPQLGFLFYPFLLLWALRVRRWRFLSAFVATFGALMLISFVLEPTWLRDWLQQISQYTSYTEIGSPVWVINQRLLPFGSAGEWIMNAALMVFMLVYWWRVIWLRQYALFDWTAALTLVITHLIALRTATPHYVAYYCVLVFCFRELARSNRRTGTWLALGAMLALLVISWAIFLTTRDRSFEHAINYVPLPLGALVVLWLMRQRWWSARPSIREGRS